MRRWIVKGLWVVVLSACLAAGLGLAGQHTVATWLGLAGGVGVAVLVAIHFIYAMGRPAAAEPAKERARREVRKKRRARSGLKKRISRAVNVIKRRGRARKAGTIFLRTEGDNGNGKESKPGGEQVGFFG